LNLHNEDNFSTGGGVWLRARFILWFGLSHRAIECAEAGRRRRATTVKTLHFTF
jgi:hypothetical protein